MKLFSLKIKLVFMVAIICSLLSLLVGVSLYRSSMDSKSYQEITTNSLPKVKILGEVMAAFRQVRIQVRSIGLHGNTSNDISDYKEKALLRIEEVKGKMKKLNKLMTRPEEKIALESLQSGWDEFLAFGGEILSLVSKGDSASMQKVYEEIRVTCPIKAKKFSSVLSGLISKEEKEANHLVKETIEGANQTFLVTVVSTSVVCFLSLLFGIRFSGRIGSALRMAFVSLRDVSTGIERKSISLRDVSTSLNDSVTKGASSLQETAVALDELSATVSKNANSAESSSGKVGETLQLVKSGKDKVEEMMSSIKEISNTNKDTVLEIKKFSSDLEDIAKIIEEISDKTKIINDIVFQTKLLSFNASVEAARAGEHGQGFSVVADEIGSLAEMSGKAAGEINELIGNSITRVKNFVGASGQLSERMAKEVSEKTERGVILASESTKAFDEIMNGVSYIKDLAEEIACASNEQSIGVSEITSALNSLDGLGKNNAVTAAGAEQYSKELREKTIRLNSVVEKLEALVEGGNRKKTANNVKAISKDKEEGPHLKLAS